jgi:phage tail-like protein
MRRDLIERLLPPIYQRTAAAPGVLAALLTAMETMHAPTEDVLSDVDDLFTAYRSPDPLVPFLLRWVALDYVLGASDGPNNAPSAIPIGRLRDLVAIGSAIAQRRGTAAGLVAVIGAATGVTVVVQEPADRPFHIVVRVPGAAADRVPLIRRVVEVEKPAATSAEVVLAPVTTVEAPQ